MRQLRTTITYLILLSFLPFSAQAQLPSLSGMSGSGSEYFVGRIEGKPLITIQLLSGVRFPGVYHIPIQTNLVQLISFAGGTSEKANLGSIIIRSQIAQNVTTKKIDLDDLLEDNGTLPVLQDKDTVRIPSRSDWQESAALYIGLIGGSLGIILSAIAINRNL